MRYFDALTSVGWRRGLALASLLSCASLWAGEPDALDRRFQASVPEALAGGARHCSTDTVELIEQAAASTPGAALACLLQGLPDIPLSELQTRITPLTDALLAHGLTAPLTALLDDPAIANQPRLRAHIEFALYRYAVTHQQWAQAEALRPSLTRSYALDQQQRGYLQLNRARALQAQGQHRDAIALYEGFSPDTAYYPEARLNLAIAHLRQGWWSDAHDILNQLLNAQGRHEVGPDFYNRARMLLGLSQLQQGYYRHARESFRAITLDSRYLGEAWRGIGLTALYQGDYPSALNAFSRQQAADEQLTDGPFLMAYAYERDGQLAFAQLSYSEATLLYEAQINALAEALDELERDHWRPDIERPEARHLLERQYRALLSAKDAASDRDRRQALQTLGADYRDALRRHYRQQLEGEQSTLQSYLSQSQYGLATTYDR